MSTPGSKQTHTSPGARLRSPLPSRVEVGEGTAIRLEGVLPGPLPHGALRVRVGAHELPVDGLARSGGETIWWAVLPLPAGSGTGSADVALVLGNG